MQKQQPGDEGMGWERHFLKSKNSSGHHQEQKGSLGQSSSQPLIEPAPRLPDADFLPSRLKNDHFPLQHLLLFVILYYKIPKTFIHGGVSYVSSAP